MGPESQHNTQFPELDFGNSQNLKVSSEIPPKFKYSSWKSTKSMLDYRIDSMMCSEKLHIMQIFRDSFPEYVEKIGLLQPFSTSGTTRECGILGSMKRRIIHRMHIEKI